MRKSMKVFNKKYGTIKPVSDADFRAAVLQNPPKARLDSNGFHGTFAQYDRLCAACDSAQDRKFPKK